MLFFIMALIVLLRQGTDNAGFAGCAALSIFELVIELAVLTRILGV